MTRPRLIRFTSGTNTSYGLMTEAGIIDLGRRFQDRWPDLDAVVQSSAIKALVREAEGLAADLGEEEAILEPPLVRSRKIICVGINFPARNEEYKDGKEAPSKPSLFVRFPGSFTGHGQPLIRPPESHQLDYEGEIAIVIGKEGRRVPEEKALGYIAALTLCNEGTIRDWVRHAKFNVTQGKNWDRSGSMGPWLVPYEDERQIANISLTTRVNGELRQEDRTGRMIFPFRRIIAYISTFTTLLPGDIIITGTPTGAGARFEPPKWLKPGDVVEVAAEGIGVLLNTVADEV